MNVPLHLTSPSRWPFSRLIISFNRREPRVSWAALLQHGYVARGARGVRRPELVVWPGSAGLVEVLPQIGPSWVSAGTQTLPPPSRLRGADVPLAGAGGLQLFCSICWARAVQAPALLFKSVITGDYFQPKQRRCVCYRFQLVTSVGGVPSD